MTDYWKSLEKKFCDTCKCWLSDNRSSIEFHENGKRHRENIQRRLGEIQKKTRVQEKEEKRTNRDLRRIEEAAAAAYTKDKDTNPDISLKLAIYQEQEKESQRVAGGTGATTEEESKDSKKASSAQPTILHREEKLNKKTPTPTPSYTSKGGWTSMERKSGLDLELPPKTVPRYPHLNRRPEKRKPASATAFEQDTLISNDQQRVELLPSISFSSFTQSPTVISSEVAFKKRKFTRSNMRQRDDDN